MKTKMNLDFGVLGERPADVIFHVTPAVAGDEINPPEPVEVELVVVVLEGMAVIHLLTEDAIREIKDRLRDDFS